MDALAPRDRLCASELIADLRTVRDRDAPILRTLPRRLRDLVGVEVGATYVLRAGEDAVDVEQMHADGKDPSAYARDFGAALRRTRAGEGVVRYNAVRPRPADRNRPVVVRMKTALPHERALLGRHDLGQYDQLRSLVCDGPTMLAWVGVFSCDDFTLRHKRILSAVIPAIQRRILLERQVQDCPMALQLLGSALEAIGAAAFLLRGQSVAHANSAGRAALATDRAGVLESICDHILGRGDGSYSLTWHRSPGAPDHVLAVARAPMADARQRASVLAQRWLLTARQTQVLQLLAQGRTNKAIGGEICCGEGTVEFHVTALLAKAECESRAELVAKFWTAG